MREAPSTTFSEIYELNTWGSAESVSGSGSELGCTVHIRRELPWLLEELSVHSILDVPCGDFNWMQHVALGAHVDYTGADIVPELVARNNALYGNGNRRFVPLDILSDSLPHTDLVFCRDCLFHFSHADVARALSTFARSSATYLLTTTFTYRGLMRNLNIATGQWCPINLEMEPYRLPPPSRILIEGSTELTLYPSDNGVVTIPQSDRCLGLWRIEQLRPLLPCWQSIIDAAQAGLRDEAVS